MIILDTDFLTVIQRAVGDRYHEVVRKLAATEDEIAVTIISFEEQMRGWLAYIARGRLPREYVVGYGHLHALLADFARRPILDFDDRSAVVFETLVRSNVRIGTMDLRIAAIAITNDALLLSRNVRDFRRVPGLRVTDWSDELL